MSHANKGWRIWDKIAVSSLSSVIHLNHWHLPDTEILQWTLAWIRNSFLSFYLFLSHSFSLSLSLSQIVLPQVSWGDPGEYMSARRLPKYLLNIILPSSNRPSKVQYLVKKYLLYRNRDSSSWAIHHPVFHFQPFRVTLWPPNEYCSLRGPKFDQEMKIFSTMFTWDLQQEWASLQQTTPGTSGVLDVLERWKYGLMLLGFRKRSLWLFMSHWIGIWIPV